MPGGAQLVSDLLQGAFGGNDISPEQAAIAAGYTHTQTTDADGKPLDKPSYLNPDTGDITDDPLSKLPMKQPGFFQRAFAPSDAARANSVNANYAVSPTIAAQQHKTELGLGSSDTARVQNYLKSRVPITDADPTAAYLATGRNPSAAGMEGTQTTADEYSNGVPAATAAEALKNAQAGTALSGNVLSSANEASKLGIPELQQNADLMSTIAQMGRTGTDIKYQPQVSSNLGKALSLEGGNTDIGLSTLPSRTTEEVANADTRAKLAAVQNTLTPSLSQSLKNRTWLDEINSRYAAPPPAYGMKINSDATADVGPTGFKSPQMGAAEAMMTGGTQTLPSGVKVKIAPISQLRTEMSPPVTNPPVSPTVAQKLQIQKAISPLEDTPHDNSVHIDENGNVWQNGKMLTGEAAQQAKAFQLLRQSPKLNRTY